MWIPLITLQQMYTSTQHFGHKHHRRHHHLAGNLFQLYSAIIRPCMIQKAQKDITVGMHSVGHIMRSTAYVRIFMVFTLTTIS